MDKLSENTKIQKISVIASLALSASIILIILKFTITPETVDYLSMENLRYEFFVAAIAFVFLYWCIWGIRLTVLSTAIDKKAHINPFKSIKIIIASLFPAGITPSGAGGEPVRIHLLHKNPQSSKLYYSAIFKSLTIPSCYGKMVCC